MRWAFHWNPYDPKSTVIAPHWRPVQPGMAQIYPQWIPENEWKRHPGRRAGYFLFDQLLRQLGDNWLVLYGSAIKRAHKCGVSDRESEFTIAHPNSGPLALQVKGGSIAPEGNTWYTDAASRT